MEQFTANDFVVVTQTSVWQGCLGVLIHKTHNDHIWMVYIHPVGTIAIHRNQLTKVTMEQIEAGEVEIVPDPAAQLECFKRGEICTCRRRMPRWRIGDKIEPLD